MSPSSNIYNVCVSIMCTNVICVSHMCRSLGEILLLCSCVFNPSMSNMYFCLFVSLFSSRNKSGVCFVCFYFPCRGWEDRRKRARGAVFFVPGTEWQYVSVEQPLLRDAL